VSDDLCQMSAIALLAAYADGSLSPVEVTQAVLEQINRHNDTFNAFCLVDQEGALAAAKASEQRWRNGAPEGRIDGVPASVKDLVLAKDWPTGRGSRTSDPSQLSPEDAPAVQRLREHGAIILGKTTTPEYGWKGVTDSPLTGITRNPWNKDHTPGGSSGGAAVAALTGMGPLHIGTDGGGSVRIPASFSGIFGFKANFGRVPVYPASPFGTLSHLGPMTRSVADGALMLTVLAGPDPRDAYALPDEARDYGAVLEGGIAGLRVAYSPDLGYATVDPEVAKLVAAAAQSFEALGAEVEQVDPGFENPQAIFRSHWYAGAAHILRAMSAAQRELIDPGLRIVADKGEAITMDAYMKGTMARSQLAVTMRKFHQTYDLLLTPTMPLPAFSLGSDSPIGTNGEVWDDWSPFTYPFNLTGQPAATVPCGFTSGGLPVGLQVVGRNYDEVNVLRAAHAFEMAHPEHRKTPELATA
jgi:aspartyl-tRNA(Asn)/glutamyl-tRNA(Gln) amidotransferase subunit A